MTTDLPLSFRVTVSVSGVRNIRHNDTPIAPADTAAAAIEKKLVNDSIITISIYEASVGPVLYRPYDKSNDYPAHGGSLGIGSARAPVHMDKLCACDNDLTTIVIYVIL